MACQPGADKAASRTWETVLGHRDPAEVARVAARLEACGLTADQVWLALVDGGDGLHDAAGEEGSAWAESQGGPLAAALLAAEVSALAAHLNARAARVRGRAVDALLDDYSAVTVAEELGVSRQKVYDIARAGQRRGDFLDRVPWRAG